MKRKDLSNLGYAGLIWFALFLFVPLCLVAVLSFLSRGTYGGLEWNFDIQNAIENYGRVFNPIYFGFFLQSLKLSVLTAGICLLLAYPMAWAMATSGARVRTFFVIALAIPFLTNLIIRVYAMKLFTALDGPLNWILTSAGVAFDPFALSQNIWLVMYGMVTTYLPFMVFPIYAALGKMDFSVVEAAQDLGARPLSVLFKVILPMTKRSAVNGFTLVFVPCLGEFVIPDLLGGAKTMLIGNLITEQFLKSRDWPFGAALSVVLIAILLMVPLMLRFVERRSERAV